MSRSLKGLKIPGRRFRPPDPTGSCREDAGKSPDPPGKHRKLLEHGSSISAGNCPDFFRWIPANFLCFPSEIVWKSSKKNLENFQPEYCFHVPAISGVVLPEPVRTS